MSLTIKVAGQVPTAIAHYTNLAGLMGMLETGELWASNVSFLNDRKELTHGLDATGQAIQMLVGDSPSGAWLAALKKAVAGLDDDTLPNTYAVCFCTSPDVLSQWRGYGGTEQGVALIFDRTALEKRLAPAKAKLYPVVYGNLSTVKSVSSALKAELDALVASDAAVGQASTPEERHQAAFRAVCRLLPQFKHNGFRDEREVRFVVQDETLGSDVRFRAKGNVLVPYVQLLGGSERLPVRSIIVGPGRDQELTKRSIEVYLKHIGYADVEVRLSTVPFRS